MIKDLPQIQPYRPEPLSAKFRKTLRPPVQYAKTPTLTDIKRPPAQGGLMGSTQQPQQPEGGMDFGGLLKKALEGADGIFNQPDMPDFTPNETDEGFSLFDPDGEGSWAWENVDGEYTLGQTTIDPTTGEATFTPADPEGNWAYENAEDFNLTDPEGGWAWETDVDTTGVIENQTPDAGYTDTIVDGEAYDPSNSLGDEVTLGTGAANELAGQAGNFMNASDDVLIAADQAYNTALQNGATAQEANNIYNTTIAESQGTNLMGSVMDGLGWAGVGYGAYNTIKNWDDMENGQRAAGVAGTASGAMSLAGGSLAAGAWPVALFSLGVSAMDYFSGRRDRSDPHYAYAKDAVPLADGRILLDTGYDETGGARYPHGYQEDTGLTRYAEPAENWANSADGLILYKEGGYGDYDTVFDPKTNKFYNPDYDQIRQQVYANEQPADWWDREADHYEAAMDGAGVYDYLNSSRDWMVDKPFATGAAAAEQGVKDLGYGDTIFDFSRGPHAPITLDSYQAALQAVIENADWGHDWHNAYVDGTGEFALDGFMPNIDFYGVDDYSRDSAIDNIQKRINAMSDDNGWDGPSAVEIYESGKSLDETPVPGVNGWTDEMGTFHFFGESGIGG